MTKSIVTAIGRGLRRALAAAAALAAFSGTAVAQQFEKVENIPKQEIPAGRFVSIAYGIIWLARYAAARHSKCWGWAAPIWCRPGSIWPLAWR